MSNKTTFYKVTSFLTPEITKVQVDRYTKASVWIAGRRKARTSEHVSYFLSAESAIEWIENKAYKKLDLALRRAEYQQKRYTEIMHKVNQLKKQYNYVR